jgi:hypothetical protein
VEVENRQLPGSDGREPPEQMRLFPIRLNDIRVPFTNEAFNVEKRAGIPFRPPEKSHRDPECPKPFRGRMRIAKHGERDGDALPIE